jgi:hypothetical protein
MRFFSVLMLLLVVACVQGAPPAAPAPKAIERATVESSLLTGGSRIRQFAFDADVSTWFASETNPGKSDHLTLRFDHTVDLESVSVLTGRPNGDHALTAGVLQVSTNGVKFEEIAKFADGKAAVEFAGRKVVAVRIQPTEDLNHPLVVREIAIKSNPKVVAFRFPIEFALDVADAPEMKEWAEKTIRVCERQYPMLCDELTSEGFKPPTQIRMTLKSDYKGVAAAGGGRITGSVAYFKSHPDDIGAMVHETAHCVQSYRGRGLPGWLVEGIADYVRFWKYEPGKAGRLQPERAKYDASYRTTAAFLAFVTERYDAKAVNKLNAVLRENKYDVGIWKTLTGKSVEELNQEWRQSLAK